MSWRLSVFAFELLENAAELHDSRNVERLFDRSSNDCGWFLELIVVAQFDNAIQTVDRDHHRHHDLTNHDWYDDEPGEHLLLPNLPSVPSNNDSLTRFVIGIHNRRSDERRLLFLEVFAELIIEYRDYSLLITFVQILFGHL